MSRQLEQALEERAKKRRDSEYAAAHGGLVDAVSRAGGILQGMSVRWDGVSVLLTLRARFPAGGMVAFVGGEELGPALAKAMTEARTDALNWRVDKYAKN